jgi:PAS domain S-box-containing protein
VAPRDGSYRWMLFSAVAAQGEPLVYLCGKDVTTRNEALAEARRADAQYRALITNLPDTVITLFDPELRILLTEGGQLTRRGIVPEEYGGKLIAETMPRDHFLRMEPYLRAALAGEPQAFDLETPDGEVIYRVQAMALHDERGNVNGGVMVARDVTERRRDERALAARAAELERSNAELAQFAYVASHDLSEPLRMVSSYLQLLRRRYHGQLDEDADEFIDFAVSGANRMRALIEDLLAYSRAGRTADPRPVDAGLVVADVLSSLAAVVAEARAQVSVGNLPAVMGDRVALAQVFQNLIANALKFRRGSGPGVWITAEREGSFWRFAVADDGIGIETRHQERVFKMFQRLHDRESFEGTGIGLAICRKIIERQGGQIWVESREGGGSVFRFTLPAVAPPVPLAAPPPRAQTTA